MKSRSASNLLMVAILGITFAFTGPAAQAQSATSSEASNVMSEAASLACKVVALYPTQEVSCIDAQSQTKGSVLASYLIVIAAGLVPYISHAPSDEEARGILKIHQQLSLMALTVNKY